MASSTPTPSPASKVCMVCKQDCSGKPRSKDEQGRYTCAECAKKMAAGPVPVVKAAAGAPAVAAKPAAKGPDDGLGKLGAESLPSYLFDEKPVELSADQEMCQNCGNVMRKNHVVCIKCGHNKQSGKTLRTTLKKPEIIDAEKKKRGSSLGSLSLFLDGWPALVAPLIGIGFLVLAFVGQNQDDQVLAGVGLIGAGIYCIAASLLVIIAAFTDSILWGLGCFLPIVGLYWLFTQCESSFVRYNYVTAWAMSIIIRLALRMD